MSRKTSGVSRRQFFRALGMGGAGLLLAAAPGTTAARADGGGSGELATLLDLSKCIGCGACVAACREANADRYPEPKKPFPDMMGRGKPEDWSERRDVDDRLTPYNWLYIQTAVVERDGKSLEINIPRRCMHCRNAPCANLCPFGACAREENGAVRIDDRLCLGGAKCRTVCPWGIPQRQSGVGLYLDLLPRMAGNGVMYKCDRCHQRLARGGAPACIEACPEGVQQIGPREEVLQKARELAASMNGHIYGAQENGGTNTIYVSPVSFEDMEQTLVRDKATGPGRPNLAHAPDAMGRDENLATAALLAPFAGLLAGGVRAAGWLRRAGKAGREAGEGEREDS